MGLVARSSRNCNCNRQTACSWCRTPVASSFRSQPPQPVAQIPKLLTDVVAACRGSNLHDAVVHHLMALLEGAGYAVGRSLSTNTLLAHHAFDVAGRRVKRSPAPWLRRNSILQRNDLLEADDAADGGVTPRRWSQVYELPDGSGVLLIKTEAAWAVCDRRGDDSYHRRREWCWVQTCNEHLPGHDGTAVEAPPLYFPADGDGYEGPLPTFAADDDWLTAVAHDQRILEHFDLVLR